MKLSLQINRHTSESELIHLGMFFTSLGLNRGARVATTGSTAEPTFSVPLDEAELHEPDLTTLPDADVQAQAPAEVPAGTEPPKRRRRTKEEIAAACATAAAAPGAAEPDPELVTQPEEVVAAVEPEVIVGNDQPAPTLHATVTDTQGASSSEPAATIAASASPSEPAAQTGPITHAEAQKYAIDAARRFGPEKVKAIIAEYEGVGKIADLPEAALSGFIVKLQALAA